MTRDNKANAKMHAVHAPVSSPLHDCLRAAETEAHRFHGAQAQAQAPATWQAGRSRRPASRVKVLAVLAVFGLVAWRMATHETPPTLTAAADAFPWHAVAGSEPPEAEPMPIHGPQAMPGSAPQSQAGRAVASGPGLVAPPALLADAGRPAAPSAPAFASEAPTLDGGDADLAASAPASVLGSGEPHAPTRVAPMNTPTVPDEHDAEVGAPEPSPSENGLQEAPASEG